MEVSSDEFWDIDGVPLNTYCWAIKSFGGSRQSVPNLRGENELVPFRPGRSFKPKQPDSRVITLAMWVAGIDPDTGMPSRNRQSIQWNDNWNYLRRLLFTPEREVNLTRRWYLNAASPVLVSATATAQLAGQMEPNMTGRSRSDFAVDLLLADPFFYGDETTVTIPANNTVSLHNPGDTKTAFREFSIEFEGNLTNPELANLTNGVWMRANTIIPLDTNVLVDIPGFKATRSTDGSSVAPSITQGGARTWMVLEPGTNELRLNASGTGAAKITFRPSYL